MITLIQATGLKRRINRAPSGKEYIMEGFLEPGLVSYDDVGAGVARLNKEAIDKMLPSFIGCPLTIEHTNAGRAEVLNGLKDESGSPVKVGEVTRAWWNAETGRFDCAFTVDNEKAEEMIKNGCSGSCAYNVNETGPGGELHAMKYDEEILNGHFEHLALVNNPRYEDCKIRINSKPAHIHNGRNKLVEVSIPSNFLDERIERKLRELGFSVVGVGGGTAEFEAPGRTIAQATSQIRAIFGSDSGQIDVFEIDMNSKDMFKNPDVRRDDGLDGIIKSYVAGLFMVLWGDGKVTFVDHKTMKEENTGKKVKFNAMDTIRTTYRGKSIEVKQQADGKWIGTCKDTGSKTKPEDTAGAATNEIMAMVDDIRKNAGPGEINAIREFIRKELKRDETISKSAMIIKVGAHFDWINADAADDIVHEEMDNSKKNALSNYQYATILGLIAQKPAAEIAKMIEEGLRIGQLSSQEAEALRSKTENKSKITLKNAKLECMECGATFSRSNPSTDTKCPKCGGYDIEVANSKNNAKCSICGKQVKSGERNPDVDYCNGHSQEEWDKKKQNASEQEMFDKEKKEHPEFSDEDIWKIVKDHQNKNSVSGLAEYIVDEIPASKITEQACIRYALEKGYSKAEGQEAWKQIFREMKNNGKIVLKNAIQLDDFEKRVYDDMIKRGISSDKALEILVNEVEGDWSQLSPGLKAWAKSKGMRPNEKKIILKKS